MVALGLVQVLEGLVAVLDLGCALEGLVYALEGLVVAVVGLVCALEDQRQEGLDLVPGLEVVLPLLAVALVFVVLCDVGNLGAGGPFSASSDLV